MQTLYGMKGIFWCDVESTGIDAEQESLLQVAGLITDPQLNILEEKGFNYYVKYSSAETETLRKNSTPIVQEMHDHTGLWEKLLTGTPLTSIDHQIKTYLEQFFAPKEAWLGGNSIVLDRNFTNKNLPQTAEHLHYRNIDVTSVGGLAGAWYGESFTKKKTHDALDDIRESLEELRYFRTRIFK